MPHFGGVITRPELALYPLRLSFSGTEDLAQASAVWVATIRRAELVEGQTSRYPMRVPSDAPWKPRALNSSTRKRRTRSAAAKAAVEKRSGG